MNIRDEVTDEQGRITSAVLEWGDGSETDIGQHWQDDGSCLITFDGQDAPNFSFMPGESGPYRHFPK